MSIRIRSSISMERRVVVQWQLPRTSTAVLISKRFGLQPKPQPPPPPPPPPPPQPTPFSFVRWTSSLSSSSSLSLSSSFLEQHEPIRIRISSSSSSSSNSNNNNNTNSFEANWIQSKNRLIRPQDYPALSHPNQGILLSSRDWSMAAELLQQIYTCQKRKQFQENTIWNRIQDGFDIMDRLCQDLLLRKTQQQHQHHHHQRPPPPPPPVHLLVQQQAWGSLLLTWRNAMKAMKHTDNAGAPATATATPASFPLSTTRAVLDKVQRYVQSGLIPLNPMDASVLLNVIKTNVTNMETTTTTTATMMKKMLQEAEFIWKWWQQQSQWNLYHPGHPDRWMVIDMAELWAAAAANSWGHGGSPETNQPHPGTAAAVTPTAAAMAESYLALVKKWYSLTQLDEFDLSLPNNNNNLHSPTRGSSGSSSSGDRLYTAVMEAHSRSSVKHPEYAETALQRIQELWNELKTITYRQQQSHHHRGHYGINTITYNRVCQALATCRHETAPDLARGILEEMMMLQDPEKNMSHKIHPTQQTFVAVLTAYAKAGRDEEAQAMFDWMQRLAAAAAAAADNNNNVLEVDEICYNSLIWAYARTGKPQKAEAVFLDLIRAVERGTSSSSSSRYHSLNGPQSQRRRRRQLQVTDHSWNGLLVAWSNSSEPDAPQRLEQFMNYLESKTNGTVRIDPSMRIKLLASLAKSQKSRKVAQEAHDLFQAFSEQTRNTNTNHASNLVAILMARCQAGEPHLAEEILYHHKHQSVLTQQHVNVVMDGWAKKAAQQDQHDSQHAAERASALLDCMHTQFGLPPNAVSYTTLLWAWARSPAATALVLDKVQHYWNQMLDEWNAGNHAVKPTSPTCNALVAGLVRSLDPTMLEKAEAILDQLVIQFAIKLDVKPVITLMIAWMNRGQPDRVEQLFQKAIATTTNTSTTMTTTTTTTACGYGIPPDPSLHVTRLRAWSTRGHPERATQVLQEWIADCEAGRIPRHDDQPRTQAFGMVLNAWVRSQRPDAAIMAEQGLQQMAQLAKAGAWDCQPNVYSFHTVITAYANSTSVSNPGEKALQLLHQLQNLAKNPGPNSHDLTMLQPNLTLYTQVFLALSRCHGKQYHKEEAILKLLQELQAKSPSFWCESAQTPQLLQRIKKALVASSLLSKLPGDMASRWLNEFAVLESMALKEFAKAHTQQKLETVM